MFCEVISFHQEFTSWAQSVLNCAQLCSAVLNCAQLCSFVLSCAQLCSTMLNCAQLCSTVLNCAQLCSIVLNWSHMGLNWAFWRRWVWTWTWTTTKAFSWSASLCERLKILLKNATSKYFILSLVIFGVSIFNPYFTWWSWQHCISK